MFRLVLLGIMLCFIGCVNPGDVTKKAAGDNYLELLKVLEHYKGDPMKSAAAEFLIDNMTLHVSFTENAYRSYCSEMDSLFRLKLQQEDMSAEAEMIYERYASEMSLQYDARNITADYLIRNIDDAFDMWENNDLLTHLDFEAFCEYVLPYKCVEGQTFDGWKKDAVLNDLQEFSYISQIDIYRHSAWRGYWAVHDYVVANTGVKSFPHTGLAPTYHPYALLNAQYTDCYEKAYLELMYCRANGIPASVDYVPNWGDRPGSHAWLNVYMTSRHNEPFEPLDPNEAYPGYFRKSDFKLPKVFRQTYVPNDLLLQARLDGAELPPAFSSVFVKDVTSEYCRTVDCSAYVKSDDKYLYLAVFDDREWVPVDIARSRLGVVRFEDVGVGVTYCVAEYASHQMRQVSDPFFVDLDGNILHYGDAGTAQNVAVSRKYPSQFNVYRVRDLLQGGVFESSDSKSFDKATVWGQCDSESLYAGEVRPRPGTAIQRFLRLMANGGAASDFAEVIFYSEDGCQLCPKLFGSSSADEDFGNLCDGNALTYSHLENTDVLKWIGFDFGGPVKIDRVVYLRRGDGNDIVPGHEYELLYNQGRQWHLHSRVTANDFRIEFNDVPSGLLLMVREVGGGTQNRVFVYHDGEVQWR